MPNQEFVTTVLKNADYPVHEQLQESEMLALHDKVQTALDTTNGDAGTCEISTRQLAILMANAVQNAALKAQLADVGTGLNVVESSFAKAIKMDPSDAPFPLVGADAMNHLNGRKEAYQHALEMLNSSSLLAFIENGFKEQTAKTGTSPGR